MNKINNAIGNCFLGRTLVLSNGVLEVQVTLDVGPRIISLKKVGGENIMFNDLGDEVSKDVSSIYGNGEMWHIYGGHRIWISPEELKTYYPDNHPVSYQITDTGAVFTPDAWRVHNVQTSLEIAFTKDNSFDVIMNVKNIADVPQKLCIWGLSVMKCGGKLTVPLSVEDTGFLANRNIVMWSYSSFSDKRLDLQDDKFILKSDVTATKPFKLGIFTKDLEAKYEIDGTTFIKRMTANEDLYPDYSCNMETYTSNLIHEVETLSPIKVVDSGDTLVHKENWEVL